MMIASVSAQVPQTALTADAAPAAAPQPQTQAQPAQPVAQEKVTISSAARALQELAETATQTAKEAQSGDRQAQRKLAAEEARRAAR
ncbi:hypothetical protein [Chromobacterium sp. ATCC 53434]|uniref:hypothetical protein n=1 Tax=Chromobacterium sp. (strain ATCC 53434 / SC 14030) TaxID=2059672 RepID=UPI0013053C57|nr:hypothetical protein [Chromobacterium sp. ATCC 53434]